MVHLLQLMDYTGTPFTESILAEGLTPGVLHSESSHKGALEYLTEQFYRPNPPLCGADLSLLSPTLETADLFSVSEVYLTKNVR